MNDAPQPNHRFLTVEQVAEQLNVGVPLVRAMLKTGELRGIQIGGKGLWRIGRADLESYIEEAYSKAAAALEGRPRSGGGPDVTEM